MKFGMFAGFRLKTRLAQGRWQHRLPSAWLLQRVSFGLLSRLTDSHRTAYFRRTFGVPPCRIGGRTPFAAGHLHLLMLFGPPGVGKSRAVRQTLGPEVGWISGQATPLGIYLQAYEHRHQPLIGSMK